MIAVGVAASIWGTLGVFAKILYAEGVSFEALAAVRAYVGWAAGHDPRTDTFEPLTGWRRAEVTERRRSSEFVEEVRRIAEKDYPWAKKIRL